MPGLVSDVSTFFRCRYKARGQYKFHYNYYLTVAEAREDIKLLEEQIEDIERIQVYQFNRTNYVLLETIVC